MATIKVFLDEDVHLALGGALRHRGFDAVHAQDLGRKGMSDGDQLIYAIQEQRCVYSFNVKDFVILHNQFILERRDHWGIIVSQQITIGESLRRMLGLLQRFSQEDMKNRLEFL